jgi:hypothetical protein
MARRLSITVPDELWDELTHLDSSPSALVQRALRCLSDKEGSGAEPTPFEAAAADIPYWQAALDELAEQATELRAEGYEAVIMAFHDGIVGLAWLDRIVQDYRPDELPLLLSGAADQFLAMRHASRSPADDVSFYLRPAKLEEVEEVLFGTVDDISRVPETWNEDHRELLVGLCRIITIQERGLLASNANGDHFRLCRGDFPTTDIPYSLFEGMASALFDTVGAVRRRVRSQSNPAELGSFLQ